MCSLWPRGASAAPGRGPVWRPCLHPPPPQAPRQSAEHWLDFQMVPLQVDECSRHDQDSCGEQEQPQAVLSLPLARPLGLLLSLASLPQQGMGRSSEHWPLSLLSPHLQALVVDHVCNRDGRRQVHCLADQLADCRYWPLVVLASFVLDWLSSGFHIPAHAPS